MIMMYFEYILNYNLCKIFWHKLNQPKSEKRETAGEAGYKTVHMEFSDLPNNSLFPKILVLK